MCGLIGCFLNRPIGLDEIEKLRSATTQLAHRGPDAQGEYIGASKGLFLGHRRLKIIDLSENSAQPMRRGEAILAYNGELYNYCELRNELLAAGIEPTTSGDTEILLLSWLKWGTRALDRFDGMFAFALFDGRKLHLVNDPFGEKPLYLLQRPEGCYFSSEPGPLRTLFDLVISPTESDTAAFLCLGFIPAPRTGVPSLECLAPGSHIVLADGRVSRRSCYWRAPDPYVGRGRIPPLDTKTIVEVEDALTASLERRLVADVPMGLFLSSGIDSALVAALMAKRLRHDIETVTVAFPDGADESAAARKIAQHLGLSHRIVDGPKNRFIGDVPEQLLRLYGDLNDNPTGLAVREMCRAVRGRLTVALSGTGGDELFYGYQRYSALYDHERLEQWLSPLAEMLRPVVREGFDWFKPWTHARDYCFVNPVWSFLSRKNGGMGRWLRRVPSAIPWAHELRPYFQGRPVWLGARLFDISQSLPLSYIAAIDRGSMSASVEVRTPFLSRELFNTVAAIDQRSLIAFGRKQLGYRLLERHLPRGLLLGRKQGFVVPMKHYFSAANDRPPQPPFVETREAAELWNRRGDPRCRSLALRLKLLALASNHPGDRT
jgi:asparagine synthase (glutamine-hydrolysing)